MNVVTNYRNLPPVTEKVSEPEAYSMTFLQHVDNCPRAGFLYRKHRKGPGSHPMDRGTAFHLVAAELARTLLASGEPVMPADVAKAVVRETMEARPDLTLRHGDRDDVRIMAFHWAEGTNLPPETVAGIEKHLELTLPSGVKVHGIADLILLLPEQRHAIVRDYKTSFNVPSRAAFERSFQTKFYAALLLFGKGPDDPVGLGAGIDSVRCEEVYPRYLRDDGLLTRYVTFHREDLTDFLGDVQLIVDVARRGFSEGLWQAVTSSHCSICPAIEECPLPPVLLDGYFEGEWKIADDPVRAAELAFHLDAKRRTLQSAMRSYTKEHGPIYYGPVEPGKPGRVYGSVLGTSNRVRPVGLGKGSKLEGKEALAYYLEQAALEGRAFDLDACYEETTSTRFTDRKHEPDEVSDFGSE